MAKPQEQRSESEVRQKIRKSNVRIVVTYFVVFMYSTTAVILTFVLLRMDKVELAIGVFSGLSTLSAGIAGFWFGNRGTGYPESLNAPGGSVKSSGMHMREFDPMMGTARRPIDKDITENPAMFPSTVEKGASK